MPPKKAAVSPELMESMSKLTKYWDKKYPILIPRAPGKAGYIKAGKAAPKPKESKPREPSWWDLIP